MDGYEADFCGTPDDEPRCGECPHWDGCPCGSCRWGKCRFYDEWTLEDDGCAG